MTRRLALGAALYALVIVAAFPTVAAMRRTFAPNGAVAGQMSQPTALAYPERARTPSTVDAGAFSWFFEPMTATAHRALAGGTVPLWNPYAGLGMPLVANAQSAVGSPLTLPVLAKPDQKVWNGVILFRLLVGSVGCLLLLLMLGATPPAAMGAALLYGLAPMFTRWAPQVSLSVEVLAPWLLAAILALVRRPGPLRFAAVALVGAAAAYGGQPEVLACLAYLGAGWGLYWWWREGRSRRVLVELVGAALCAAPARGPAGRADARVPADLGRLARRDARRHPARAGRPRRTRPPQGPAARAARLAARDRRRGRRDRLAAPDPRHRDPAGRGRRVGRA